MDRNPNWYDIGNEIRSAVEDSLRTGDFSKLGYVVTDTVNGVVDEAKRQVSQTAYQKAYTKPKPVQRPPVFYTMHKNPAAQRNVQVRPVFNPPRMLFQRKGDVAGVLLSVFGGIITGVAGVTLTFTALGSLVAGGLAVSAASLAANLAFLFCGGSMLTSGAENRKLLQRAERYLALCQGRSYINVSDLAGGTGTSEKFVRKNLKKMIAKGIFPQGHLDAQQTCLMISDDTYREYLAIEQQRKNLALSDSERPQSIYAAEVKEPEHGSDILADAEAMRWRKLSGIGEPSEEIKKQYPELARMIWQGQECTGHIRDMNERIPGEVISQKLDALENVLKEIFKRVLKHPEQMGKMQKFMDYYLPTTLKLVEAYEEFDQIASPSDEILEAKAELEKTIDTITHSFEELLNQLFSDSVFDVTTDAKVLQTMLAKDGLARDHAFDTNKR